MLDALPESVSLYEVTPRDGLQNEASQVATHAKVRLIEALVDAGLPVAGFDERLATMEEIFLASVGASKDALAAAPAEAAQ